MSDNCQKSIHFVGIGGVGQSALARYFVARGWRVSGSDRIDSATTDKLRCLGVVVHLGHDAANVGNADLVVRTSAVGVDNVEVSFALANGIDVTLREQLLGKVVGGFDRRICVAGTHGKTTTTALIHHVLRSAGVEHAAFIGGEYKGNNFFDGKQTVVCEACEYNRGFLNLAPTVAVCVNMEFDHPDCYESLSDVRQAFDDFCCLAADGIAVLPTQLAGLSYGKTITFGNGGDIQARNVSSHGGKYWFDLYAFGRYVDTCRLSVVGRHNVDNALCAIAACVAVGVLPCVAAQAVCSFCGVDRRWTERQGRLCNIVSDYAHHPTEIRAAVQTAKEMANNVVCVFQPHTFSRTKAFMQQFVDCFVGTSVVYLPIYAAREQPVDGVDSQVLCRMACDKQIAAAYAVDFADAVSKVSKLVKSKDDVVLVLGAGNVVELADIL